MRRMLSAGDEKRWCGRCGEPETCSPVRAAVVAFSGDWTLAYMKLLLPKSVDVASWVYS